MFTNRSYLVVLSLLIGSLPFLGSTCNNDTTAANPNCGEGTIWTATDIFNISSDLVASRRYFVYEDTKTPQSICPDEHISLSYTIHPVNQAPFPDSVTVLGYAYWSLYGHEVRLRWNSSTKAYEAHDNVGLKQAFGSKPGYIGAQIHINFPNQGSYGVDKAYVDSLVIAKEIIINYYESKK
jgi:hypothetical protein